MKIKHILVKHEFEAKDIQKKLNEGKSFEDLARDFSLCPSAKNGGDLGDCKKGQMVPPFEKAFLALKVDEISGIVKTPFGHHLIKRIS